MSQDKYRKHIINADDIDSDHIVVNSRGQSIEALQRAAAKRIFKEQHIGLRSQMPKITGSNMLPLGARRLPLTGRAHSPPGRARSPPGRARSPHGRPRSPRARSPPGRARSPHGRPRSPPGRPRSPPGRHFSPPPRNASSARLISNQTILYVNNRPKPAGEGKKPRGRGTYKRSGGAGDAITGANLLPLGPKRVPLTAALQSQSESGSSSRNSSEHRLPASSSGTQRSLKHDGGRLKSSNRDFIEKQADELVKSRRSGGIGDAITGANLPPLEPKRMPLAAVRQQRSESSGSSSRNSSVHRLAANSSGAQRSHKHGGNRSKSPNHNSIAKQANDSVKKRNSSGIGNAVAGANLLPLEAKRPSLPTARQRRNESGSSSRNSPDHRLADSGRDAKRSPNKHGGHRGKSPQRDTIVKPSVESVKKVIKTKIASAPAPPKPTISPELNYDEDDYELNKLLGATSDSDLQPQYLTPREEVGAVAAGDDDVDDEAVRGNARTVEEDGELVGSGGDDEALVDDLRRQALQSKAKATSPTIASDKRHSSSHRSKHRHRSGSNATRSDDEAHGGRSPAPQRRHAPSSHHRRGASPPSPDATRRLVAKLVHHGGGSRPPPPQSALVSRPGRVPTPPEVRRARHLAIAAERQGRIPPPHSGRSPRALASPPNRKRRASPHSSRSSPSHGDTRRSPPKILRGDKRPENSRRPPPKGPIPPPGRHGKPIEKHVLIDRAMRGEPAEKVSRYIWNNLVEQLVDMEEKVVSQVNPRAAGMHKLLAKEVLEQRLHEKIATTKKVDIASPLKPISHEFDASEKRSSNARPSKPLESTREYVSKKKDIEIKDDQEKYSHRRKHTDERARALSNKESKEDIKADQSPPSRKRKLSSDRSRSSERTEIKNENARIKLELPTPATRKTTAPAAPESAVPSSTQLSSARQAATAAAAAAAAKRAKITFDIGAGESQKRTFKLVRDQNKANETNTNENMKCFNESEGDSPVDDEQAKPTRASLQRARPIRQLMLSDATSAAASKSPTKDSGAMSPPLMSIQVTTTPLKEQHVRERARSPNGGRDRRVTADVSDGSCRVTVTKRDVSPLHVTRRIVVSNESDRRRSPPPRLRLLDDSRTGRDHRRSPPHRPRGSMPTSSRFSRGGPYRGNRRD